MISYHHLSVFSQSCALATKATHRPTHLVQLKLHRQLAPITQFSSNMCFLFAPFQMMSHPQSHVLPLVNLNLKHLRSPLPDSALCDWVARGEPHKSAEVEGEALQSESATPPLGNNKWDVIIIHLVKKKKKTSSGEMIAQTPNQGELGCGWREKKVKSL